MDIKIEKYHGLGNDYLVYDPNVNNMLLNEDMIKLICHRNCGVGSDGLLYGPIFEDNRTKVRIYNPDGSEAEKSGNGIRIFSRYLLDAGYAKNQSVILDTLGGSVATEYLDFKGNMLKVEMGKVSFMSDVIPVIGPKREVVNEVMNFDGVNYRVACLSIGNPHCVVLMEKFSSDFAKKLGPIVESDYHFPKKINMQLMKVIDRNNIQIEIYERGAGYTLSSGSSSCAAASVAYKLGLVDNQVRVHMPGGCLEVRIQPDGMVHLSGPVSKIGTVILSDQFINELKDIKSEKEFIKYKK